MRACRVLVEERVPRSKELEAEVWCSNCHAPIGEIYRVPVSEQVYRYVTVPSSLPKYCGFCDHPTVRKVVA